MARRPRYRAHPDANQPQIVSDLEALGFLVLNVSRWMATPDLFVWGYHLDTDFGYWTAWEVKTEDGSFTDTQREFMMRWPGAVEAAYYVEDILKAYGRA